MWCSNSNRWMSPMEEFRASMDSERVQQTLSLRSVVRQQIMRGDCMTVFETVANVYEGFWENEDGQTCVITDALQSKNPKNAMKNRTEKIRQTATTSMISYLIRRRLECQHFIELVRNGDVTEAVKFARIRLCRYQNEKVRKCVGLVAYKDPESCPLRHFLGLDVRSDTADLVNAGLLLHSGVPERSPLHRLLQHLIVTTGWHHDIRHHRGLTFTLPF